MPLTAPPTLRLDQRLGRLEDPGSDFPFYNGAPTPISGAQWLAVMLAVAAGFLVLTLPIGWPGGAVGAWLPALLFPALPLAALACVSPAGWRSIFGRVGRREVRLMVGFALLNIVVSMSVGAIVSLFTHVTANAATSQLATLDTTQRAIFFARTVPQLFGEEVVTVLPFLALMQLFAHRWGMGRRGALVGAWLGSSLLFALIHLPTYDWQLLQCVVIIGTARLVLSLPWILTKNIWVSTGAHILNDWLLFSLTLLGAGLVAQSG